MTSQTYPAFNLLETAIENKCIPQSAEKLKPVKVGQTLTDLFSMETRLATDINASKTSIGQKGATPPYLNKILVVYFYSGSWGEVSLEHLKQLNAIRNEIKYHDANLVIIDSDGPNSKLQQLLWNNNLSLQAYTDPGHKIARAFGVYTDTVPVWSRYPGVNDNVPLPGVFVLDHFLRVVLDNANEQINTDLNVQQITDAAYRSNHYQANRRFN